MSVGAVVAQFCAVVPFSLTPGDSNKPKSVLQHLQIPNVLFFLEGGSVTYFKTSSAYTVSEVFTTLSVKPPQSRAQHNKKHQCAAVLCIHSCAHGRSLWGNRKGLNRRKGSTEKATKFSRKSPVETRHRVFQSNFYLRF